MRMAITAEHIKTKTIKWLIRGGLSFKPSQHAIGAEVLFAQKQRRADLLIISNILHSIEIKGDRDNTSKLRAQITDYIRTFDKVSIITTPKHLNKIQSIVPPSIGIILFENNRFTIKKLPTRRKRLNKISLLMFLDKQNLIANFQIKDSYRLSTQELRVKTANKFTMHHIRKITHMTIKNKYARLFKLFLKDTGGKIVWDELRGLCGKINRIGP